MMEKFKNEINKIEKDIEIQKQNFLNESLNLKEKITLFKKLSEETLKIIQNQDDLRNFEPPKFDFLDLNINDNVFLIDQVLNDNNLQKKKIKKQNTKKKLEKKNSFDKRPNTVV